MIIYNQNKSIHWYFVEEKQKHIVEYKIINITLGASGRQHYQAFQYGLNFIGFPVTTFQIGRSMHLQKFHAHIIYHIVHELAFYRILTLNGNTARHAFGLILNGISIRIPITGHLINAIMVNVPTLIISFSVLLPKTAQIACHCRDSNPGLTLREDVFYR